MILSRTHRLLWAFLALWIFAIAAPTAFGQEMTRFELEERVQEEEDTTEVDWMNDTTGVDTIEYRAVDLVYDVDKSTFNLSSAGTAVITILNSDGAEVATLRADNAQPGFNTLRWNGENVPSGRYLVRIDHNGSVSGKNAVLK